MRGKGINYDTGFFAWRPTSTGSFDPAVVRRELQIIADDLHCNGGPGVRRRPGPAQPWPGSTRRCAGLEVWFAPFPCELTTAERAVLSPSAPSGPRRCAAPAPLVPSPAAS